MPDSKMFVDIREKGKIIATCTLDLTPAAKIKVSGLKADYITEKLTEGVMYTESGKTVELRLGRDDLVLMTSLYVIMSGSYVRASAPYFDGEKPPQLGQ